MANRRSRPRPVRRQRGGPSTAPAPGVVNGLANGVMATEPPSFDSTDFDSPADPHALLSADALAGWQRRLSGVAYTRPSNATGLAAMKLLDEWMSNGQLGADAKSFGML